MASAADRQGNGPGPAPGSGAPLPRAMLAMCVTAHDHALRAEQLPLPTPGERDVLVRVRACGVCRTDLHVIDGELAPHRGRIVPGHEVVGEVVAVGPLARRFAPGQRVGIPWLGGTCACCPFCESGSENLCDRPVFTGYDRDGGFAEYCAADERFCIALPQGYDDLHAAPLLCAGLIGYRAWQAAGGALPRRLALWGFGAAAHIVCQLAVAHGQEVHAFTREGDAAAQAFARSLGALSARGSAEAPAAEFDASIIFAPDGALVPAALRAARKGGTVVCAGIHMSTIPAFDYQLLWGERQLRSVANLTRADGEAFFRLIDSVPVRTHVQPFALRDAALAVQALREGRVRGAAVLVP